MRPTSHAPESHRPSRSLLGFAIAAGLLLASCGGDEGASGWRPVPRAGLSARQETQRAGALAARDELFGRLMARLQATMADEGPAAAIAVCRDAAPEIAAAVSDEQGVQIGRTSHRLRNPANAPAPWAKATVEARQADEAYFAHPDGRLGVLLPIRLQARCLTCHGCAAEIPDAVDEALATLYPEDDATGFREGALRGFFQIEVPPPVE